MGKKLICSDFHSSRILPPYLTILLIEYDYFRTGSLYFFSPCGHTPSVHAQHAVSQPQLRGSQWLNIPMHFIYMCALTYTGYSYCTFDQVNASRKHINIYWSALVFQDWACVCSVCVASSTVLFPLPQFATDMYCFHVLPKSKCFLLYSSQNWL